MKLFKYSTIDGAFGILNDRGVKLTNPTSFNDVFDCRFEADKEQNIKGFDYFKKYAFFAIAIEEIKKRNLIPPNKEWFLKEYARFLINIRKTNKFEFELFMEPVITIAKQKFAKRFKKTQKWFDKQIETAITHSKEEALVACFSKRNDSLLMWSHYADSHKGVCFEFEYESPYFYDVKYKTKIPRFDVMAGLQTALASEITNNNKYDLSSINLTLEPFYTKSAEWEYEQEVRGIFNAHKSQEVHIANDGSHYFLPMPKPKRIYIGCRAYNPKDAILLKKLNRLIERARRLRIEVVFLEDSKEDFKLVTVEKDLSFPPDNAIQTSLFELIKEMNNCLCADNQLGALSMAFTIVSLFGKIYHPNEDKKTRFIAWCNDYLINNQINPETKKNNSCYLNADFIWDIKERFQNYGDFNISGEYGGFRLDYVKVEKEKVKPLNIICNTKTSNSIYDGRNCVSFSILNFCSEIEQLSIVFYKQKPNDFDVLLRTNVEDKDCKQEDLIDVIPWN